MVHIIILILSVVIFGIYADKLFLVVDTVFVISFFIYIIFYLIQKPKMAHFIYKLALFVTYIWIMMLNIFVLPKFSGFTQDGLYIMILILRIILVLLVIVGNTEGKNAIIGSLKLRPAQSFVIGFLLLILTGALLLTLPVSVSRDHQGEISFINSLFTSTSAVCVTGLTVVDTGTYFSIFGQIIILILIQFGGLGIMTFGSFIAILLGNKIPLYSKAATLDIYDQSSFNTLKSLIKTIILGTFLIELIGIVIIFFSMRDDMFSGGLYERLYFSIFHSISAFCNAGFSIKSDNLISFNSNWGVNFAIINLIIVGGIGFPVILNLRNYFKYFVKSKIRKIRTANVVVRLQTKVVILVTIVLIVSGALLFMLFEWENIMAGDSIPTKILESIFQSVTTRTAGFNTIDMTKLQDVTYLMMIILMFIGASSGSTGGGIKTTTFFILLKTAISVIRDSKEIIAFRKKVSSNAIFRAVAILSSYLFVVLLATMVLLFTEKFNMLQIIFEVVSAIATVGLSTGITFDLSNIGKIVITIVMFTGRIGVLTFLYVFVRPQKERAIDYPEETLSVG